RSQRRLTSPLATFTLPPPAPCLFTSSHHPRALPSFPTRRSSDLRELPVGRRGSHPRHLQAGQVPGRHSAAHGPATPRLREGVARSEEHTSELQSRFDLVCRLLLEKKNKVIE